MMAPYGEVIRRLRRGKRWSQQELAEKAGINVETVVRAEQSGNVGVLLLYQIANALGVELSEIFGGKKGAAPAEDPLHGLGKEQRAQVMRLVRRFRGEPSGGNG